MTVPRSRRDRRHSIGTVLAVALCALLCGARSLRAIGQWPRSHPSTPWPASVPGSPTLNWEHTLLRALRPSVEL
ncbi:transposase family protein [Nocardiopsis sp. CNT-189]|uniref:transposase family protein n=1 Tax=Nocardiopsis oceanisediminis TaxID=2816862 RepID=UPI003B3B38D6